MKQCGNCKYWRTLSEEITHRGKCKFPFTRLPASVFEMDRMNADEGTECPCWEPIEESEG